jgi:hypothetical protein
MPIHTLVYLRRFHRRPSPQTSPSSGRQIESAASAAQQLQVIQKIAMLHTDYDWRKLRMAQNALAVGARREAPV